MMRLRNATSAVLLLAGVLGMASCDKAKLAVTAAREKFRGATDPDAPVTPGGDVTPTLASQVDNAAEGVRFRRDLPFPTQVNARVVHRFSYDNIRRTMTSALGKETIGGSPKMELVALLERHAKRVSFTIERSGELIEQEEGGDSKPVHASGGGMPKIDFEFGPRGWRVPQRSGPPEFQSKMREQALLPTLEASLSQNGLAARKQWFSPSRRWAAGDKLVLEGDSLEVLFAPHSTGKVTLVYEVSEPIDGHPCGRFSISGDVQTKNEVSLSGEVSDRKLAIKSGKVWCSLLHPLVLREELDMVLTEVEGSDGGAKSRIQGSVKTVTTNDWKPTVITES